MILQIAAAILAPTSTMAATEAPGALGFRVSWTDRSQSLDASLSLSQTAPADYTLTVAQSVNGGEVWRTDDSDADGPVYGMRCNVFPMVSGYRLIRTDMDLPNWRKSVLWVVGRTESQPWALKYRDEPTNVFKLERKAGKVSGFVVYDRWIGGVVAPRKRNGTLIDRLEEVSRYRLVPGKGAVLIESTKRVVPALGGGVHERTFSTVHRYR